MLLKIINKIWMLKSDDYFIASLSLINLSKCPMFSLGGKVYSTTIACSLYVGVANSNYTDVLEGAYLFDIEDLKEK